jgi:hypothetical protein
MIEAVINEAAEAYRGIIPADCLHEPYMTGSALEAQINAGVESGAGMIQARLLALWDCSTFET